MVSHNTHKKMVSCLQGHMGADAEKRHVNHLTVNQLIKSVTPPGCVINNLIPYLVVVSKDDLSLYSRQNVP